VEGVEWGPIDAAREAAGEFDLVEREFAGVLTLGVVATNDNGSVAFDSVLRVPCCSVHGALVARCVEAFPQHASFDIRRQACCCEFILLLSVQKLTFES
jgi:hypothetical protein